MDALQLQRARLHVARGVRESSGWRELGDHGRLKDHAVEGRLEHTAAQHEAIIRVADSGPGVPEESLGKIFRPFYRIDDARGRQTGGVGLGLAITDRVVRLHGGTVHAENRPEGGLVVEIRLPAVPAQPDIAGLKQAASEIEEHAT